jgi:hypothetical protein
MSPSKSYMCRIEIAVCFRMETDTVMISYELKKSACLLGTVILYSKVILSDIELQKC